MLARQRPASASQTTLDLVAQQQHIVGPTNMRDFRQIIRRRHVDTALVLNRFDQKSRCMGVDAATRAAASPNGTSLKRGGNGPKPSRYWTTEEKPTIEMSGGGFNRASFFCAARAMFRTLENYVSLGEIRDVIHVLPEEILTPWPPLQLPMWSSEAPLSNR